MKPMLASAAVVVLTACGGQGQADTPPQSAGAPGAASAVQVSSETRTFGDWTAVCDNGNNCAAYAGNPEGGAGWVMIKLDAGPEARPQAMFGAGGDGVTSIRIAIDGQSVGSSDLTEDDDGVPGAIVGGAPRDVGAFLDRIAQGRSATLFDGGPEEPTAIPLRGAAAAFLWIDERQGRLNTTTALIRKGPGAASTVPSPGALPSPRAAPAPPHELSDGVQRTAIEALPAVKTCREEARRVEDQIHDLGDNRLLWSVLCFQGAYNTGQRFFITGANGENPQAVLLPSAQPTSDDVPHEDRYVEINAEYDADTRTLSAFSRGRGVGDCGALTVWTWTGRAFELKSEHRMDACAGISPGMWPTTWRTR